MATRPETPINVQTIAAELMAAATMVRGLGSTTQAQQPQQQYGRQYSLQQQPAIAGSPMPLPPSGSAPRPGVASPSTAGRSRLGGDVNNPVAKALMAAISGKAIDQHELENYEDEQLSSMLSDLDRPVMRVRQKSKPGAGPSAVHPEIDEAPGTEQMSRLEWQQQQYAAAAEKFAESERRNAEKEVQMEAKRQAARAITDVIAKLTNDASVMAAEMRVRPALACDCGPVCFCARPRRLLD